MSSLVLPLNIGPRISEMLPTAGPRADTRCPPETAFEVIILPMRAVSAVRYITAVQLPSWAKATAAWAVSKAGV